MGSKTGPTQRPRSPLRPIEFGTELGVAVVDLRHGLVEEGVLDEDTAAAIHKAAQLEANASAEFADRARQLVVELQSGDVYCNQLWLPRRQMISKKSVGGSCSGFVKGCRR